jgi:hypothetical protein
VGRRTLRSCAPSLRNSRRPDLRDSATRVFQLPDSRRFVHLYTNEGAVAGALQQLPAFHAFVAAAQDRHEQPATFTEPELIGDYRTFADTDRPAAAGG